MSNPFMHTELLDKAIVFAVNAHRNSERRGKNIPYVIHPLEAMAIVATMTDDQELLAAAALHDVVEDTDAPIEDIEKEFGKRVAKLVASESIIDDGNQTWKERKALTIEHVKNSDLDSKMIAMGDKLSNMRAIYMDYMAIGDKLWDRFHNNDPKEIGWYYRSLAEALSELKDTFAYKEYIGLLNKVFK